MDLHISKLNLEEGQLIVEGDIIALQYSDGDYSRGKVVGFSGGSLDRGAWLAIHYKSSLYIFATVYVGLLIGICIYDI